MVKLSHYQVAVLFGIVNNGGSMHKAHIPSRTFRALVRKRSLVVGRGGWCELTIGGQLALAGYAVGKEKRCPA